MSEQRTSKQYLSEILEACDAAAKAFEAYQGCKESDPGTVWDARAKAYEKTTEIVGAYWREIAEYLRETP